MLLERVALACARVRVIEGGRRSRRGQREGVCGRTPRCRGRSGDEVEWLEREVETALSVGLPAGFVDEPPLPLPTSGAVRFTGQAQLEAGDALPDGMFISASTPSHSVRTATSRDAPYSSSRATATRSESPAPGGARAHSARLERWARDALWAGNVLFRWSTQDLYSLDRRPFIGAVDKRSRIFTATGFGGWG